MNLQHVILGSTSLTGLATPKFEVRVCRFAEGVSTVKAIQTFASLTKMTLPQAKWFLDRMPQKLAISASEYFQGVVMNEAEAREVAQLLQPYFNLSWSQVGGQVLPFDMVVTAPWAVKSGEPSAPANAE